jgi:hypothetical protein
MHLLLFSFFLLCAVSLWKLRYETRHAIRQMTNVLLLLAAPVKHLWSGIEWWRLWVRREVWIVIALSLTVLGACACAPGQAEARARNSLDVLAAVIDPAWALAEDSCLASQRVEVEREGTGLSKPADTDAALASIRAKCDAVTDAFERIRLAHIQAGSLLDRGQVASAQALLEQILADWQALRGAPPRLNADGGSS